MNWLRKLWLEISHPTWLCSICKANLQRIVAAPASPSEASNDEVL